MKGKTMDIVGQSTTNDEIFVIRNMTDDKEITDVINDLRREVISGRTRWFCVVGAGVEYLDVFNDATAAAVSLDRADRTAEIMDTIDSSWAE